MGPLQAGFENEQTFPVRRRERVPCTVRGDCSVPERLLAALPWQTDFPGAANYGIARVGRFP